MNSKQSNRLIGTLARRKINLENYKLLFNLKVPQVFGQGKKERTFDNQKNWEEFIVDKIKKAEKNIQNIEEKIK